MICPKELQRINTVMNIQLKKDCYITEWSGRTDREVLYKKGDEFEVDPDNIVDGYYDVEGYDGGPDLMIPVKYCEEVK